jgi:RimJ/RimL family protein N-acetyltransferase
MTWLRPVELRGSQVSLVPLNHGHANDLVEALCDGELWKLWYTSIPSPDKLVDFIDQRLAAQAKGTLLPFAVLDNATGKAVGTTNYLNVDLTIAASRLAERGTGKMFSDRTSIRSVSFYCSNTPFETLLCIAVEFRTHFFNYQSRRGIERLGAKLDGILRSHQIAENGTLRDTFDCEGAPYVADGETKTARDSVKST